MLIHIEMSLIPIDDAARQTGLHPEILRMLVRDGVIDGDSLSCEIDQAEAVAAQLGAARAPVEGEGILASEVEEKYGFTSRSVYNWYDQGKGWIQAVGKGKYNALLFNEGDIAFARALADLRGIKNSSAVFPAKPRSGRPRKG